MTKQVMFVMMFVFAVAMLQPISGAENNTIEQSAALCINESHAIMNEMIADGFSVTRINDSLKNTESFFSSQTILKEKKKKYDFSVILPYCAEISAIRESALESRDELNALMRFYNNSVVPGMDVTEIDKIIREIRGEISNERYEQVGPLVDKAYSDIITVKSSYTALNVFYKSTTRNLETFLENNWKVIVSVTAVLLMAFLFYRIKIMRWINERKIEQLKMRKKTLKELIMKTQTEYFQHGTIPEGEYNIKTKKFSEMILDIDRQIPLLQEKAIKLGRKEVFSGKKDEKI